MSDRNASEKWEAILGDLQLRVTRPSFETWLRGTKGISLQGEVLVVGTPNTFVSEMLEQRMYSLISEAAERVVKTRLEVKFQVLYPGGNGNPIDKEELEDSPQAPGRGHQATSLAQSGIKLNDKYTFDNFVVGSSNALAHAAAMAVSDHPGKAYNPLVIHSGVGLGKTHLLQAIGHQLFERGMALVYASTEQFTNEYIMSIRNRTAEEFRDKYRSVDVLLLDDIQFIMGKEQTQEGFFHTFNTLHMANRQIVISSDRPVRSLTLLSDRIRSRLEGGLVVDINPPEIETRLAILQSKARNQGVKIEHDVLMFLAEVSPRNIRELEGNLNRVIAYAQLTQAPVTIELVERALGDILSRRDIAHIPEKAVIDTVAAYFGIEVQALLSRKRDRKTALARQVAMYLLRQELNKNFADIGRTTGGKDHTTVIHACNKITSLATSDPNFRQELLSIRELLLKTAGS